MVNRCIVVASGTALAGVLVANSALALAVTPNNNANSLANVLLGSGVTIVSASYTGAAAAAGTFSGGIGSGIGIAGGVILSSGAVASAVGPNNADNTTTQFGTPGTVANGFDAAQLDIEFTTDTGSVFFNYSFASEEYNEFTNSQFNDSFSLLLNGTNIALIPGTSTPVQINTVNGGNPFGTAASNANLFNNNDPSDGGPFFDIAYDGFTDVFTATGAGLGAGTNLLTFLIQDIGDSRLDSAIFLEGGSLGGETPGPAPIPLPASFPLIGGVVAALGSLRLRRKRA